jgi:hypothetical protein
LVQLFPSHSSLFVHGLPSGIDTVHCFEVELQYVFSAQTVLDVHASPIAFLATHFVVAVSQ